MNELQILTNIKPGIIEFNNEDIKQQLTDAMKEYEGLTFTEDTIPIAKSTVAEMRKVIKKAEDARKTVKKEFMKPYDEFEGKVKELVALVDNPINMINAQLEDYEEDRKDRKRQAIRETYEKIIDGFGEYLPLDKIYDVKWENKTFTLSTIEGEITTLVDSTAQAINTISAMNSDAVVKALEGYKLDLSLVNAITYINNYEQQKAEIEARAEAQRKEEEEARIRAEEQRKIEAQQRLDREVKAAEERAKQEVERVKQEALEYMEQEKEKARVAIMEEIKETEQEKTAPLTISEPVADEPQFNFLYSITATESEFTQIEMYLDSLGIDYDKED